jgi:hypothetical protein
LNLADRHNKLQQILSPNPNDEGVWIHQDAWFHMGKFDENHTTQYQLKKPGNGVYAFVLNGAFNINGQSLEHRDGLGIWNVDQLQITANSKDAEILLMEVPLQL